MYSIEYTNRFKKDLQMCQRRGMDVGLIKMLFPFCKKQELFRLHIKHIS